MAFEPMIRASPSRSCDAPSDYEYSLEARESARARKLAAQTIRGASRNQAACRAPTSSRGDARSVTHQPLVGFRQEWPVSATAERRASHRVLIWAFVDTETRDQLDRIAERNDRTRSAELRRAVERHTKAETEGKQP